MKPTAVMHEWSPILARYLVEIRDCVHLSRDAEAELSRRIRAGAEDATRDLVEANLGFVVTVAREYRGQGLPFEDLINEGNVGLLEAARRFQGGRSVKFITYAVWWIRKAILRALADQIALVRLPQHHLRKMRQIRAAGRKLEHELGRAPFREEVSRSLSWGRDCVDRTLRVDCRETPLDEARGPVGDRPLADALPDRSVDSAEDRILRGELGALVARALLTLGEQERTVLRKRFGLDGEPPQRLRDVGETLGVSRERVRQIQKQAIERLRRRVSRGLERSVLAVDGRDLGVAKRTQPPRTASSPIAAASAHI